MKKSLLMILSCLIKNCGIAALLTCSPEPIASCTPLQSVLHTWPRDYLEYCENRLRLSTCTGVIWVDDHHLISIGVHNHSIDTYYFDPDAPSLVAYKNQKLKKFQKTRIGQLENLDITKDGSIAAVVNNGPSFIHLYKISNAQLTHIAELPKDGWWAHGVRFSPQMDYIAYTLFENPGKIRLFRLQYDGDSVTIQKAEGIDTTLYPMHPKALDFSPDERFIVVCHSINNSRVPKRISGALTVHSFDRVNGKIDPTPISTIGMSELLCVPEDVRFTPDGLSLLVTNHGSDTVTIHAFDPETGQLGESQILLQNPEAKLSFPHGLSFSPDGKYLSVTNYGDDTVKIYAFTP